MKIGLSIYDNTCKTAFVLHRISLTRADFRKVTRSFTVSTTDMHSFNCAVFCVIKCNGSMSFCSVSIELIDIDILPHLINHYNKTIVLYNNISEMLFKYSDEALSN